MKILVLPLVLIACTIARADLVITEVMAQSGHTVNTMNGDWWELTNTGATAVDLTGYKWDDTPTPLTPSVSNFPAFIIQPGESIIIVEENAANIPSWKAAWGLDGTRVIDRDQFTAMGGEGFSGLGADGDQVNLYNAVGTLVARADFGASTTGKSFAWHPDGTVVYGLLSAAGKHGAVLSNQSQADTGSPGNARVHFLSSPQPYGRTNYSYAVSAQNPGFAAPVISAAGLPGFLTLTPGTGGTAVLASNRPLTLADAGNYLVSLTATSAGTSTIQEFLLAVLYDAPMMIVNEYNAVSAANFLNGGSAGADSDGGVASSDATFGRVAGNGGAWVECVVTGSGGAGLMDLRGWKLEIGQNIGSGFTPLNTLVFSNHPDWQKVPTGTILTFIDKNTAQGGRDSAMAIRDRRTTIGDTWSNVWIGDTARLTYTDMVTNGYSLIGGVVGNVAIGNNGTQFRIRNAAGQIVFGPVGEGVAPASGINSTEIFELEGHPTPAVSPLVVSTSTSQGYSDGAADSTFGLPNTWLDTGLLTTQSFAPYVAGKYLLWTEIHGLSGNAALSAADPDGDGRSNLHEYAFGGSPAAKDAGYPAGTPAAGALVTWTYVRRNNDPSLVFGHEASINLAAWDPIAPSVITFGAYPADPDFSSVTVQFTRPVPTPAAWFLRASAR